MTFTTPETCGVGPFIYRTTAQPDLETGASGNNLNEQALQVFLLELLSKLCTDMQSISTCLQDLESRIADLEGISP